uniref:Secreted protein n=1 Tax=Steinernema glaseri TaxID=37863 RepID=A0A1I8AQK4_9BILA
MSLGQRIGCLLLLLLFLGLFMVLLLILWLDFSMEVCVLKDLLYPYPSPAPYGCASDSDFPSVSGPLIGFADALSSSFSYTSPSQKDRSMLLFVLHRKT